jgi:hypothetical protein
MCKRSTALLVATLALGLPAAPAFADQQDNQQQKMTPMPIDTGGKSLSDLFDAGKKNDISFGDLPSSAQQTVSQWAQGGKVDDVRRYTLNDGRVFYQARVKKAHEELQVIVTPEGQTVRAGKKARD